MRPAGRRSDCAPKGCPGRAIPSQLALQFIWELLHGLIREGCWVHGTAGEDPEGDSCSWDGVRGDQGRWGLTPLPSTLLQQLLALSWPTFSAHLQNRRRPGTCPTRKETWSLDFHCHLLPLRDKTRAPALPLPTRPPQLFLCPQM